MEPENSMRAFNKAIELGLDGVELDVWLTKDGFPVVVHGHEGGFVDFLDGLKVPIGELALVDLQETRYTLKTGEKIPTLAEVLDQCKDNVCVNIELKETKIEVVAIVLDLLQERDMLQQITFSSFHHCHRRHVTEETQRRNISDKVRFGFLMKISGGTKLPDYDIECQEGDSLNVDIRYLEKFRDDCIMHMEKAKAKKMTVGFWFPMDYVHEDIFYDELLSLGVDTIITNKPTTMIEYFAAQKVQVSA